VLNVRAEPRQPDSATATGLPILDCGSGHIKADAAFAVVSRKPLELRLSQGRSRLHFRLTLTMIHSSRLLRCIGVKAWLGIFFFAGAASIEAQEKPTVIHIRIDEKHDRLTPDVERDIEWIHEYTITLSTKNSISEVQRNVFAGSSQHPATPQRVANLTSDQQRELVLGQNTGKIEWQVLGPKKLRRIGAQGQSLAAFDVSVDERNNCHITVRYLKQLGFVDTTGIRAGTNTLEHFALSRLISATCSVAST